MEQVLQGSALAASKIPGDGLGDNTLGAVGWAQYVNARQNNCTRWEHSRLQRSCAGEHTVREHPSCAGDKESLPTFRTAQHCEGVGGVSYSHCSCSENKWIVSIQVFSRPNLNQAEQSLSSSYNIEGKNHRIKNIKITIVLLKKYPR